MGCMYQKISRAWGLLILFAPAALMLAACSRDDGDVESREASEASLERPRAEVRTVAGVDSSPIAAAVEHGSHHAAAGLPQTADDAPGPGGEAGAAATAGADSGAAPADATEQHEIRGVVTQWDPPVTFANPGDRIVFRQMAGHDTEAIADLIPAGATPWKSAMGAEGFSVVLDIPGAYIYKCNPHVSTGMVAAIVVGDVPPANFDALVESPLNKGMIGRAIRQLGAALEAR